jgi:hypothetical protein
VTLDRIDLKSTTAGEFARWLGRWRERWKAGEQVRVLLAADESHAIVVTKDAA